MTRFLRILTTACVVSSVVACVSPSPEDSVSITMFRATPDSIEAGQTSHLIITVNPPDAQVMITEVGDMTGRPVIAVSPLVTTTYHLIATNGNAQAEGVVTVSVGNQNVVEIGVDAATEATTAGNILPVTLTAIGSNGLATPSFRGTVHLASSDTKATLPTDLTFTAADAGVKVVKVVLKTAGLNSVTAADTLGEARRGTAVVTVRPAAAATCAATQAPTSAVAGSLVGMNVVVRDAFANVATSYTGTIRLTATDARAQLPPDVTYSAGTDAGSHGFSAVLITTGVQTLTAMDTANAAIHCNTPLAVTPAAPKLILTVPASASAGYPVNVGVAVRDVFDNALPNYTGTVRFVNTDTTAGAVTPAPITFSGGAETASASATFMTLGLQTLSAIDSSSPAMTGTATTDVHGLVYSAPTTGRVRLVVNPAQSNAQVVQLDLVANERLEVSTFFGGGPGSFAAGMNLPLDTTRATGDTTLFTAGNALVVGTAQPVSAARIGATDHVLYTAVSRKRVPGTVFTQSTEVQKGQVFYSVRLRLQADSTVGPVFDGAQPGPLFVAAVRDQYGDNFVGPTDFGVGKLEVQ